MNKQKEIANKDELKSVLIDPHNEWTTQVYEKY